MALLSVWSVEFEDDARTAFEAGESFADRIDALLALQGLVPSWGLIMGLADEYAHLDGAVDPAAFARTLFVRVRLQPWFFWGGVRHTLAALLDLIRRADPDPADPAERSERAAPAALAPVITFVRSLTAAPAAPPTFLVSRSTLGASLV